MIKHAIPTVLLAGLLCASVYAQDMDIVRGMPLIYPKSGNGIDRWNVALIAARLGVLERQATWCGSARSMVLKLLARVHDARPLPGITVGELPDSKAFFFVSRMTIDADGAPNAYHPDNVGLDDLANAGKVGHWNGIVTDRNGSPLIQNERDPFPGYYISCTSLFDKTKNFTDPTGYIDASKIPYIALPSELADQKGMRLGDFAFVVNLHNGKSSYAIYADMGTLGEGSIALADALGIWSNARRGGESDGILYLLFPGSGNKRPRAVTEIRDEGERVLFSLDEIRSLSSLSCPEKTPLRSEGERLRSPGSDH